MHTDFFNIPGYILPDSNAFFICSRNCQFLILRRSEPQIHADAHRFFNIPGYFLLGSNAFIGLYAHGCLDPDAEIKIGECPGLNLPKTSGKINRKCSRRIEFGAEMQNALKCVEEECD
jgi:hypothetical protein